MAAATSSISSKVLCLAAACACAGAAVAGPAAPVVNAGSASYNPATLTVTSTSVRTQIAWPSFHVSAGEVVKFVQPSSQSSVLNQVFDPHALDIQGGLSSNGSVYFLSGGRVSGSGVQLDLVGMISSALRLPRIALATQGITPLAQPRALTTLAEGRIYVISEDVQAVTAAGGEVLLNPGRTVELAHAAMIHLRVELTAPRGESINLTRLIAANRDTDIFAGLFRIPAAARAATSGAADAVSIAAAQDQGAESAELRRFLRYAMVYAQLRRESSQQEGRMLQVAAVPGSRMLLPELTSRLRPLPRDIAIGVPGVQPQRPAIAPASVPVAAVAPLSAATPQPQAKANAIPDEAHGATLRAPAPAAPAAVAAATPQPVVQRKAAAPGEPHWRARELASAQPAQTQAVQLAPLQGDGAQGGRQLQPANPVVAIALAPPVALPVAAQPKAKEVLIVRHAPRYFTDYRGAMFFM